MLTNVRKKNWNFAYTHSHSQKNWSFAYTLIFSLTNVCKKIEKTIDYE